MKSKLLSQKDIEEARRLRREKKLGKRRLAILFRVSSTTIWENVYNENYRRPKRIKRITIIDNSNSNRTKCIKCEKLISREVVGNTIPLGFQIGDHCISCYLRPRGLEYKDLL